MVLLTAQADGWVGGWLAGAWLIGWLAGWWLATGGWLAGWLVADWVGGWLVANWLVAGGRQAGWLAGWMVGGWFPYLYTQIPDKPPKQPDVILFRNRNLCSGCAAVWRLPLSDPGFPLPPY